MDIFSILSYLNKISLLAFIVTAGFLGYQFYLLKKEASTDSKKAPTIPDFNENIKVDVLNYTRLPDSMISEHQTVVRKDNNITLISLVLGTGLIALTLGVFILLRLKQSSQQVSKIIEPTPTVKTVALINKLPSPTVTRQPIKEPSLTVTETIEFTPTPTVKTLLTLTPSPTEVVVALISPTVLPSDSLSKNSTSPTTIVNLPLTGIIDQSLIFFGIASSLILFAFVF